MFKFTDLSDVTETDRVSFFEALIENQTAQSFEALVDALILNNIHFGVCSFDSRLRLTKRIDRFLSDHPNFVLSGFFINEFSEQILGCEAPASWSVERKEESLFELSRLAVIGTFPISCAEKLASIRLDFVCSMHRHDFKRAAQCMLILTRWDHDEVVRHAAEQAYNQLKVYSASLRFTDIDIELGYYSHVTG